MKRYLISSSILFLIVFLIISAVMHYTKDKKEPTLFGAAYMTKNNPFFIALHESIEEVVKGNGDILISRDSCQSQERQNAQILEMIEEGIEVLFLNPIDAKKVKPALEACRENNVAVINIDTIVEDTDYVVSMVETNNYQAGVLCAEEMMRQTDSAQIVIIGNSNQTSMKDRISGFCDTIEGHNTYQVVYQGIGNGEFEVSAKIMEEFLEDNIPFNVIFGGNDPTALGALATLQRHRMEKGVLIYGIDGSPDFKNMLSSGVVNGTCAQSPKIIGKTAAEIAYQYRNGKKVERYISIDSEMITKDNLSQFEINDWK